MATKKSGRSTVSLAGVPQGRRANAPGRVAGKSSTSDLDVAAKGDIVCSYNNKIENVNGKEVIRSCKNRGTVFRRWTWWCAAHDPGNVPLPGCKHDIRSPLHGVETCSMCGFQDPEWESP